MVLEGRRLPLHEARRSSGNNPEVIFLEEEVTLCYVQGIQDFKEQVHRYLGHGAQMAGPKAPSGVGRVSGGPRGERAAILRQLDGSCAGTWATETVRAMRKWRRHLQRAQEMRVSIPDPSILLRGVDNIAPKTIDSYPDVQFRLTALSRTQLQYRLTLDGVLNYYNITTMR